MVNLVIVSHSHTLAQGVAELAGQMSGESVRILTAAGVWEGDERALGTDTLAIFEAVQEAWSEAGVLILLDMGSAALCAEMAWEMLEPAQQARVRISNAPLVEGAVVAALQASLGQSLDQVNQAAEESAHARKVDPVRG